ncbi:hypothetical protein BZA77DRAFT_121029 [Pyronema omphalodes]|nr:hypothetical protein BZA77DRAFT_121029 [Pyronema omphalodes]
MGLPNEQRALPARINPVLKNPPPYQELVENRRMGQTNLGGGVPGHGPFSYVHLRISLPSNLDEDQELFGSGAPESYFLMRRSKDGFISATGMFKASFPYARKADEEAEKAYVKSNFKNTSKEETAGNIWVAPIDALTLAEEYGIKPWIEALLDNEPAVPSDHRKRGITPPPPFFRPPESDAGSVSSTTAPPSVGTRRRITRSMSPGKQRVTVTPRKPRGAKAAAAKDSSLKKEATIPAIAEKEEITTLETTESTVLSATTVTNGDSDALSATTPIKNSTTPVKTELLVKNDTPASKLATPAKLTTPVKTETPVETKVVKVEVDDTVETTGDDKTKEVTHIKIELPSNGEPMTAESTEEMIARAREMVAEARKVEGEAMPSSKRKAEEVEDSEDDEEEDEEAAADRKAKRTKILEAELRKEKVKNRALLGLSATLALGALLPYVL